MLEDAARLGGVESVTRTLVDGLRARGHDAAALSWFPEPAPFAGGRPVRWLTAKVRRARAHGAAAASMADELHRQLLDTPELVVLLDPGSMPVAKHLRGAPRWGIHMHWSPDLVLRPWLHLAGEGVPPVLRRVVSWRMRQVARRNRRILNRAPFVVTLTQSHTRALHELGPKVREVPNPADLAVSPLREPSATLRVVYLGRISYEKGPDLFVKAAAHLKDHPDLSWVMGGAGPMDGLLRDCANEIGAHIEFHGWVREARALLESADVFVLPSRTEAVPLVLAEALAAGCLVVAADAGTGVRDVLLEGRLGRIVPVDDVVALAAAIADAAADRRSGLRPDAAALRELVQRHDPLRVLGLWESTVAAVAGSPAPPRNDCLQAE
ncbi:glycosyltransferase family 4 protein [Nocardioides iriomotensis]|uniref:glycosyltransferase family 4 protein n=1 Tax=Nocardioides iriomotensis TaxID=715784 RepID=UPI0013E9F233|nr:glycosyltransferase family 4 protein [Nocardioides iriomotensis]